MYDLKVIEDFQIELKEELSEEDRQKLLLILFSYKIYWVAGVVDELSKLKNFVYVVNRQLYHSSSKYTPWANIPMLTYEDIIN